MNYVEYEYYKSDAGFGGTKLTEAQFVNNRKKAQSFIDRITFHRIELWGLTESEIPDYIRDAVCDLAEQIQAFSESGTGSGGGLKTSESVGKQSVQYSYESGATQESVMYKCAMHYIHGTKFAYRGY